MIENINQLRGLLATIDKQIENRLKAEQIDKSEIDQLLKTLVPIEDKEIIDATEKFRDSVIKYVNDTSFRTEIIPELINILEKSLEKLKSINNNTKDIGGRDYPNKDIIELLRRNILTINDQIYKRVKDIEVFGKFTEDGFIEITHDNIRQKGSLRRLAIFAFGRDVSNQWAFWEVIKENGECQNLEYYKHKLERKIL